MGTASFVLSLIALLGVCASLVPLLNILNCVTLPLALLSAVLGLVRITAQNRSGSDYSFGVAGLVLSLVALLLGGARFLISFVTTGGIF